MIFDIVIIGGGTAGLSFARSMAGSGLEIALVETKAEPELADPAFDGREIALTHHTAHLLQQLGLWERLPADEIYPLRDAQVLNGSRLPGMRLDHREGPRSQLGYFVSNRLLRRAAHEVIQGQEGLTVLYERRVTAIEPGDDSSRLHLSDGSIIEARLVVGADSRFSQTRRVMGIAADSHDFGSTMLLCRMSHEGSHHHVAWEWFGHGQTLAMLPLGENHCSIVLTLRHTEIEKLMASPDDDFARIMEQRFEHRLGRMEVTSTRHAYPLVGVYARRFHAQRYALIGDAAVGMHPVTAHGFNFGLLGQDLLARTIRPVAASRGDIADPALLAGYGRELRRATRPLYLGTMAIVKLYTNDTRPARLLRRAVLSTSARLPPLRRAMVASVMQAGDSKAATRPLLGALRSLRP